MKSLLLRGSLALAAGVASLTAISNAQAQLVALGSFTATPNGGSYNYDISLANNSSTLPIGTLWYAWTPGQFYLPSSPSSVTPPSGWSDSIIPGSGRYSIEFTANSTAAAIQPFYSLDFKFTSVDTPATLNGLSAGPGSPPVGTSVVYSGDSAFSGSSLTIDVTEAPEPSSLVLIAVGSLCLVLAARRKSRIA